MQVDIAVEKVVEEIKSRSKKISGKEEVSQVGTISANGDSEIGSKLSEAMEKVGEEATETVIAAKDAAADPDAADAAEARQALLNEVADLWFHTMVMLDHLNMDVGDVLGILEARFGTSGHDEKASRQR